MKALSSSQINQVMAILSERGISSNVLRDELTDHLCCAIEYHMSRGSSFEEAIALASQEFNLHEMNHIQSEVKNIQFRKMMKRTLSTTAGLVTLSCVLFLFTLSSFEPPSILPFKREAPLRISSSFGMRHHPIYKDMRFHRGVDFPMPEGTSIVATADGVVAASDLSSGYGKHIVLNHEDDYTSIYANLQEVICKPGQTVSKGQLIGYSGNTGTSTAPHLHYEVRYKGEWVDPEDYFQVK